MEWSYVVGAVVFVICCLMFQFSKSKTQSVTDSLLDEQKQADRQVDPAKALDYEDVITERPKGVSEDGWLSIYTTAEDYWYGHTLFQTMLSYGFELDDQQCLIFQADDITIRVMKATQPMTFDMDLLAQQKIVGLVWAIDLETGDATKSVERLKDLTSNFVIDMNARVVNKEKEPIEQEWFETVLHYLNAKQLENI